MYSMYFWPMLVHDWYFSSLKNNLIFYHCKVFSATLLFVANNILYFSIELGFPFSVPQSVNFSDLIFCQATINDWNNTLGIATPKLFFWRTFSFLIVVVQNLFKRILETCFALLALSIITDTKLPTPTKKMTTSCSFFFCLLKLHHCWLII